MADLLSTDRTDSGEIPAETAIIFKHRTADTVVLTADAIGEATANLAPYLTGAPTLRRPDATGEIPLYEPETIGVVDGSIVERPTGPSTPPPMPPQPTPDSGAAYFVSPVFEPVDEDVLEYAAYGSPEGVLFEAALTEPAAEHPVVRHRRRAKGRVPLPSMLVLLIGVGLGWLANIITVLVMLDWFRSVNR